MARKKFFVTVKAYLLRQTYFVLFQLKTNSGKQNFIYSTAKEIKCVDFQEWTLTQLWNVYEATEDRYPYTSENMIP